MSILGNPHHHHTPSAADPAAPAIILSSAVSENRAKSIRLLTVIVCGLTALGAVGLIALMISQPSWQLAVLSFLYALCAGYSLLALNYFYAKKALFAGLGGVFILFGLAMLGTGALLANLSIPSAVVYVIFALLISSMAQKDMQANVTLGIGLLVASGSVLAGSYAPLPQLSINLVVVLTPAIMGVLFMIYMTMLAMQFVTTTLRIRLVTVFLSIVIIPLSILSVVQTQFTNNVLSREVSQGLQLAAMQTSAGVDKFMTDTQESVKEAAYLDIFGRYLSLPANQRAGSKEEQEMRLTLRVLDTTILNSTIYLSSYDLLNIEGMNVYDTLRDRVASQIPAESLQAMGVSLDTLLPGEGQIESDKDYFLVPARSGVSYLSQVEVTSSTRGFFYVSAPVKDKQGHILGVLRARFDGLLLQDLLKQYNGLLTSRSYAILVDDNNIRLADAFTPNYIYKSIAPLPPEKVKILQDNLRLPNLPVSLLSTDYTEFDQILNNFEKQPTFTTKHSLVYNDDRHSEIGAISKLRSMPWRVVYLRADYTDAEVRRSQSQLAILVTVLIAGVVAFVAVGAAQLLSNPIIQLTKTAQSIASGDLEAQAPAHNSDEFGMLGAAFNLMTGQMHTLITQLEDRVKARTQEIENQNEVLGNRARQLQTVAEVARQIVSSQELELLLASITRLVSDRFGFYHVGIFLLDENKQYAILRAANSEGGQRMLSRGHTLPVGKVGIVGSATGTGEAKIVTDVGSDAIYFNNPDLPDTRSEMALPLKVGDQVIGALDIQSVESNAFHEDDIELFNTLADQVAIAIYNNELYTETLQALDEAQNLHRQYLRGEWAADTARRKTLGYLFNHTGVTAQQTENPLWKKVFNSGESVYAVLPSNNGAPDKAVMAVPVSIRGETIGVIHVQDQGDDRIWSEDEIAVVNSIANQVAVALENARLFENTVRRAEREKKVLQITAKIRATNNPGEMMQIAVSELQQALHASRTQIYIRQAGDASDDISDPAAHENGHQNGGGHNA